MTEQYHLTARNGKPKTSTNEEESGIVDTAKRFWRRLRLNEWTFTFILFLFSSSIVLGKLFLNHDYFTFLDINPDRIAVPTFNKTHPYYKDDANKVDIEPINRFVKAAFGGLATVGITWFIIYEDSNVPGVNPPSPFSPSKKSSRTRETSSLQINYLVGILNGFLVFFYMCL